MAGILYLIPTTLGENPPLEVLPISVKKVVEDIDEFIVENEKNARRFIKRLTPKKSQPKLTLHLLNKYTDERSIPEFLQSCEKGNAIGLLSDAGVPAVADPGANIVRLAHKRGIKVVPLVGPSSITLAMMSSGLNGQNFAFNGYLPIDQKERKAEIKRLEKLSAERNQSQIFIETPYRNNKLLEDLSQQLHPDTLLCVACDITLPSEFIKTLEAKEWKFVKEDFHKRPAIFILHK